MSFISHHIIHIKLNVSLIMELFNVGSEATNDDHSDNDNKSSSYDNDHDSDKDNDSAGDSKNNTCSDARKGFEYSHDVLLPSPGNFNYGFNVSNKSNNDGNTHEGIGFIDGILPSSFKLLSPVEANTNSAVPPRPRKALKVTEVNWPSSSKVLSPVEVTSISAFPPRPRKSLKVAKSASCAMTDVGEKRGAKITKAKSAIGLRPALEIPLLDHFLQKDAAMSDKCTVNCGDGDSDTKTMP